MAKLHTLLVPGALALSLIGGLTLSAHAATINTTDGVITTTPGTTAFGEVGQYVSGGTGLVGHAGVWPDGPSPAVAASNIDHFWVQGTVGNPLTWQFNTPGKDILVFAGIDHGPIPQEPLEYILYGSNDGVNWEEGKITAVYEDGWDSANTSDGHSDDFSGQWSFSQGYKYVQARAGDHLLPHYNSDDFELDGVAKAGAVPEPGTLALLGVSGVAGLYLRRRKK